MVDGTEELPVAEEPTPVAEEEPKKNVDALLAELEKVGVESPQQLQGKLDASAQAGKAFQMLGDERKLVAEKDAEIARLMAQIDRPETDDYGERPINISEEVRRGVRAEMADMQNTARKAQEVSMAAYNAIKTDPNYHLVADIWEEKEKNPAYVYQVTSGQVDPIRDFQNTVVDYYKNIAKEAHGTITELVGKGGASPSVPHVESGESHSPNVVTEGKGVSANRKFLDAIRKKVYTEGHVLSEEEEGLVAEATLAVALEGSPE